MIRLRRRLRALWSVLLGRPTAYRITFVGPVGFDTAQMRRSYIVECSIAPTCEHIP